MSNSPVKIDATLSDWEEQMVEDLAKQYDLQDDVILQIGVTFLVNEMSASMNGKQSLLNSMHSAGVNNDVSLPDVIDESSMTFDENDKTGV